MITFVLAPATAGFLVLASPLATVLFAWHRYTTGAAADTAIVIAVAGTCLIPYAINQAQTFAFFALGDAKTPALLNLPVVVARIGIDLIIYHTVPNRLVAAAMMGGNTITYLAAAIAGWRLLRRRGLHGPGTGTSADTSRAILAAILSAAVTGAVGVVLRNTLGTSKIASITTLAVGGLVLLGSYLLLSALFRNSVSGKLRDAAVRRLRIAGTAKQ
jgi:putative peptidoglycan lipid II flippase